MKILAVLLVVLGLAGLLSGGLSWTTKDTVVDAGPIKVTKDKRGSLPISPIAGGLILVAGVALLVRRDKR